MSITVAQAMQRFTPTYHRWVEHCASGLCCGMSCFECREIRTELTKIREEVRRLT